MAAPAMELVSPEALRLVWGGAIPLLIRLHELEIASLPPPPPALILAPRIGYLPLLVPVIHSHYSSSLPPGNDSIWFDYNGLPLKWYIPTGVLFDLLCAEPERPWTLTVHFRKPPEEVLSLCDGEDSVKWSYMNSLKEAAYIISGSCKNIMNMSQADQVELWKSILKGNMDMHSKLSSRLKLGPLGEDFLRRLPSTPSLDEPEPGSSRACRIPVRLYVRTIEETIEFLEDASSVDSWEEIMYINRPFEISKGGRYLTLKHAMQALLPAAFGAEPSALDADENSITGDEEPSSREASDASSRIVETDNSSKIVEREVYLPNNPTTSSVASVKVRLIRVQGIGLEMDIPFIWVVNNLKNPEHYLHICVYVSKAENQ